MYNSKYIIAQQAKVIHSFTNIKKKLLKTNAAIWFNKLCRNYQVTPKYINIKVNGNNKQSQNTKKHSHYDIYHSET
jgi:hypothetical protein